MKFLNVDECEAWSTANGYGLRDRHPLPEERGLARATIRTEREDTPAKAVATSLQRALGDLHELLIWTPEIRLYQHSEDQTTLDNLRALAGEERPASELNGQLLVAGEELALRRALIAAVDRRWYAYFLPAVAGGRVPARWVRITANRYIRVTSSEPDGVREFAGAMERLGFTPTIAVRTELGEWVDSEASA